MSRKSRAKTNKATNIVSTPKAGSQTWVWLLLAATVTFIAIIRIRLLQTPLERDEGEFAYMGQLILRGIPPYKIACSMKLPGTYVVYALFMRLFGQTIAAVHVGLLVVNLISILLVFILARRMLGPLAAVIASASFGLLSISPSVLGTSAHATQYVLPFALGGILLMLKSSDSGKPGILFVAGLLLGIGLLMKQQSVFFLPFALLYYVWSQARRVSPGRLTLQAGAFALAMIAPYAITCLILYKLGVFDKFWFWTFEYARKYSTEVSFHDGLITFGLMMKEVLRNTLWLWILGGIGLTSIVWSKRARANGVFLVSFLVFSFLTVCPGMYFRQHYFITFLPALAILMGSAVSSGVEVLKKAGAYRVVPIILFLAIIGHFFYVERDFFFEATPGEVSGILYKDCVFESLVDIGQYLRDNTTGKDKVVVFGSEPELYFYSQRLSGTTFIYTYSLVELHRYAHHMQEDMMREIEQSQPEYMVIMNIPGSWIVRPQSDHTIFKWAKEYFPKHYELVGVVEYLSKYTSVSAWGEDVKGYTLRTHNYITIIRRKP